MVGGVDSSLGSSAYLKGAQLGSGSSANRNKPAESTYSNTESAPTSFVREKESVSSSSSVTETKEAPAPSTSEKTELQAKNDDSTLQTEQTRGSLLDIAV